MGRVKGDIRDRRVVDNGGVVGAVTDVEGADRHQTTESNVGQREGIGI